MSTDDNYSTKLTSYIDRLTCQRQEVQKAKTRADPQAPLTRTPYT